MNVVILHKAFCKIARDILVTSQDGMMGRDDRRSRYFGRRTDAESTGEATGDTAVATTGVAMTLTTAARCMAKGRRPELASTVGK